MDEDRMIRDVQAEAAVVASVLLKPDLIFYSENLTPNHFTSEDNAFLYWAVRDLVNKGHQKVDTYSIVNTLYRKEAIRQKVEGFITVQTVNEMFEDAGAIARDTQVDYIAEVNKILDAALRREMVSMADEYKRIKRHNWRYADAIKSNSSRSQK